MPDLRRSAKWTVALGFALALHIDFGNADDAIDWSKAQMVSVRLIDDRFVPEKLHFRTGTPYRLHLENAGSHMHEFTAPEFLKAVTVKNREVLFGEGHEMVLQPNEAKDLYFVADKAGAYPLTCADHDWDGMIGEITIE